MKKRVRRRQPPRKKAQPTEPKAFAPTAAMIRYLFNELEFLGKRRPYTQKQVAEAAKVSEFQASRWHDVNGYDAWHAEQLHGAAIRLFNRGKVAVGYRILMTGDPKELETFGRVLGLVVDPRPPDGDGPAPAGGAVTNYNLNLLVPRPDMPPLASAQALIPRPTDVVVLEAGR
jgi:hypothetical protein